MILRFDENSIINRFSRFHEIIKNKYDICYKPLDVISSDDVKVLNPNRPRIGTIVCDTDTYFPYIIVDEHYEEGKIVFEVANLNNKPKHYRVKPEKLRFVDIYLRVIESDGSGKLINNKDMILAVMIAYDSDINPIKLIV